MIYLTREPKRLLIEHSKMEFPNEACGILAGNEGKVKKVYQMTNKDKSATRFFMEPTEQFQVMKDIRNSGLDFIGIYHSHPETEARPSGHDVELAYYPEVSYVIVSLKDKNNPEVRSFRIVENKVEEEEVKEGL